MILLGCSLGSCFVTGFAGGKAIMHNNHGLTITVAALFLLCVGGLAFLFTTISGTSGDAIGGAMVGIVVGIFAFDIAVPEDFTPSADTS